MTRMVIREEARHTWTGALLLPGNCSIKVPTAAMPSSVGSSAKGLI